MRLLCRISTVAATLLLATTAAATTAVPVVYEDNYVTIRAGITDVGLRPLHLGDVLSFIVAVEFESDAVQVENLDDAWFERVFSDVAAVHLAGPAEITVSNLAAGRVRVTTLLRLQLLDCPDAAPSCAGSKSYTLPVASVSYRLAGSADNAPDSRSARFRPWPGTLTLASALAVIPTPDVEFAELFPTGAHATPVAVEPPAQAGPVLLLAGAALLVAGFVAGRRPGRSHPAPLRTHRERRRWETAMAALARDDLQDDEWSDLLRRSLTWYCLDELGRNPFGWLGSAGDSGAGSGVEAARALFLEVLQCERVAPGQRSEWLGKLEQLTQTSAAAEGDRP